MKASAAVVRFYPFESRSTGGSSSESLSQAKKKRDGIHSSQQRTEVGDEKGKEKGPSLVRNRAFLSTIFLGA